jgi:membrane protein required for beta-lactamase induction
MIMTSLTTTSDTLPSQLFIHSSTLGQVLVPGEWRVDSQLEESIYSVLRPSWLPTLGCVAFVCLLELFFI